MKYSVITAAELTATDLQTWRQLQQTTPTLKSPYFCPEFTVAAAAVRNDVRVAVLEEGGTAVGFFPFQRGPLGKGRPVGGALSDYHGAIVAPETAWCVEALLRACGLAYWEFDHLVAEQLPFERYHSRWEVSPALDLSQGFAAYRDRRRAAGAGRFFQLERKARKLAREVGPLRFVAHTRDSAVLDQVFQWKSEQCRRTGVVDFFAHDWARALVQQIWQTENCQFAGQLSALYAGDQLVATHMGMRSASVWHWWFPGYERKFAKYSPGGILLRKVAEEAAAQGLQQLDLGKGDDAYKNSFADCANPIAEGFAWRPSLGHSVRSLASSAEDTLRETSFIEPARPLLRLAKRWLRRQRFA
ncbi:Acetyltransferase involved in cellulose biosynthesis, CelD/BcsL family [Microbulbifer donghaiensis]|uniref:Acetyltransferase involved in cellulose biosynthesis, CelD/BcsL family n=1 Tax=Microbulbifer donghaiensis TaxID=494016 RepID=A0A1M5H5X6_9GAMM|nr:GNAT family N-acetyltransferase [Microbulbifer donghaiensis]SHG11410.1 Acetyltransferase involved in cellulose biosynthesis, CelD/BcsL family [Microbulbifer donghaiensis]